MATFSFNYQGEQIRADIPDDVLAVTAEAVAATYGYRAELPDLSPEGRASRLTTLNPQTKTQFMLAHLIGHLNQILRDYVHQQAMEAARRRVQAPEITV